MFPVSPAGLFGQKDNWGLLAISFAFKSESIQLWDHFTVFPLTRGSGIQFVILSFISQRWVRPPWLLGQIEWKGRMLGIQHIVCLFFFLSQTLWIRRSAQNFYRMNKQKDTWMESEVLVDKLAQPWTCFELNGIKYIDPQFLHIYNEFNYGFIPGISKLFLLRARE